MAEEDSPLIKALPPESDYYTYLTIIEYNLSPESLPTLHKVLQDQTLTTNIGWDLVHLLVPYLPESEQCLRDIARLGNPREVILKVTESLQLIEYEDAENEDSEEQATEAGASPDPRTRADSSTYPMKTALTSAGEQDPVSSQARELPPPLPLATSQFIHLVSMLAILHARIKTQKPSRFLSTTLQAILASFSKSTSMHREEMVLAIVSFIKSIAGTKRPGLPSRQSSSMLGLELRLKNANVTDAPPSAADPEQGSAGGSADVTTEERGMQTKLLQSFITHIMEEYLLNLQSIDTDGDVPGMVWSSRIMEKRQPERVIPYSRTFGARFAEDEKLHRRVDIVGQLLAVAQDLKINDEELLSAAITVEEIPDKAGAEDMEEDEPPKSADEIPLSRLGSLMLYTARQAACILYDVPRPEISPPFAIFPDHHELLKTCLSTPPGPLGTEPESLVDAILALGLVTLDRDAIGEPTSDEQFAAYLQVTALLSSNCPSPNLRGHAHYLTSTILRSHPDDKVRLAFIRDTLEHCPFENLKVSAVGWVKGETIEANPMPTLANAHEHALAGEAGAVKSVFATPVALLTLGVFLFPSLQAEIVEAPIRDAWMTFRTNVSFYLASLNFLFLLLQAKHLHHMLQVKDLWTKNDVKSGFLQPIRDASERFRQEMTAGGGLEGESSEEVLAELNLLDAILDRVQESAYGQVHGLLRRRDD